jgi:hypothetical protein
MLSKVFFRKHAVIEIMCKNIVESVRPLIKIWRMGILCWPKAKNMQSE